MGRVFTHQMGKNFPFGISEYFIAPTGRIKRGASPPAVALDLLFRPTYELTYEIKNVNNPNKEQLNEQRYYER